MDIPDLAARVKLGIERKQVILSGERLVNMARRQQLGLVWILNDLSRNTVGKYIIECAKYKVPVVVLGDLEMVSAYTGQPTVKVYLIKSNFSGLTTVLHSLGAAGALET